MKIGDYLVLYIPKSKKKLDFPYSNYQQFRSKVINNCKGNITAIIQQSIISHYYARSETNAYRKTLKSNETQILWV